MILPTPRFKIDISEQRARPPIFAPNDSSLIQSRKMNHIAIDAVRDFFNSLLGLREHGQPPQNCTPRARTPAGTFYGLAGGAVSKPSIAEWGSKAIVPLG